MGLEVHGVTRTLLGRWCCLLAFLHAGHCCSNACCRFETAITGRALDMLEARLAACCTCTASIPHDIADMLEARLAACWTCTASIPHDSSGRASDDWAWPEPELPWPAESKVLGLVVSAGSIA